MLFSVSAAAFATLGGGAVGGAGGDAAAADLGRLRSRQRHPTVREEYPDIDVEVTLSNNEEMIAKLRATGGPASSRPAEPRPHLRRAEEYDIYKPMDLSKIECPRWSRSLEGVKANTTIDGQVYAVPHLGARPAWSPTSPRRRT